MIAADSSARVEAVTAMKVGGQRVVGASGHHTGHVTDSVPDLCGTYPERRAGQRGANGHPGAGQGEQREDNEERIHLIREMGVGMASGG